MTDDLTRRTALAGIAATTVAAVLPSAAGAPAYAATPAVGKQAAGYYRYMLGSFEITVVTDGVNRFPLPDDFVSNTKKDDVKAGLAAAHMDTDVFFNPYNPIVVNTGSRLVVIDTGTGEA